MSQDEVNEELSAVIGVVKDKLGDRDLTVALGNHDAFPNGQWDFAAGEPGPSKTSRDLLKQWVPESEQDRWDQHAYYAKDLTTLKTRILSLNTESCDFHNMLLWDQLDDPNGQIAFIESNLSELEALDDDWKAVIIGHIPDECSHEYSERFRALLDRY